MKTVRKKQRHVADAQLAAMVIAMRLPVMAMESMTDKAGRPEANRAVSEKVAAADGWRCSSSAVHHEFCGDVLAGRDEREIAHVLDQCRCQ